MRFISPQWTSINKSSLLLFSVHCICSFLGDVILRDTDTPAQATGLVFNTNIQLHWATPLGFYLRNCIHFIVSITNQIYVCLNHSNQVQCEKRVRAEVRWIRVLILALLFYEKWGSKIILTELFWGIKVNGYKVPRWVVVITPSILK